jgi:hypothetical protein
MGISERDQKYLEGFELWCCRRIEKVTWIDGVGNNVLHTAKKERKFLNEIKSLKVNCTAHVLCMNCLLKQDTEGKLDRSI